MKVLVCGGRDFTNEGLLVAVLSRVHYSSRGPIRQIIHGDARGADRMAGAWAVSHAIPVRKFPAKWTLHRKAAGPIRNRQMLVDGRPDVVVAFKGGVGTHDMIDQAERRGIPVLDYGGER